jgi:hypothetical protein
MEILVSLTLVSFGVIAFGMAARYLPIFPGEEELAGSSETLPVAASRH